MLRWYQASLKRRPFATQVLTTVVLFGAGDVMAQQLVQKKGLHGHDYARTGRMMGYGGIVFGPAATQWYKLLAKVELGSKATTTIARVAADQVVFAPVNMALFLSTMAYFEGASPRQRLESIYLPTLMRNYMVWPPVQALNFTIVPLEHRVLVVNVVSLGWNCYISYANSQGGEASKQSEKEE